MTELMTVDEAIRTMRADPACADLIRDAYLGRDVADSARRFLASSEWSEVRRLLGTATRGAAVLDLGAGTGIASWAFLNDGAAHIVAVDPDPSDEVGRGAATRLLGSTPVEILDGVGEAIPLPDASVEIVYCRQVLHHARDLDQVLRECARVLKPGGTFLACREHVVDDEEQLAAFLASHPTHQLAGGENAFALEQYTGAITGAGLRIDRVIGPWESVINAFPAVRSQAELDGLPAAKLEQRFGALGRLLSRVPGVSDRVRARIDQPVPGRMYSFLARRPR